MHSSRSSHKDFLKSQSLTRRRRKRKIIRLWIMFFVICILIALATWIISLQSMAIKKIVVVGNANITSDEIQRITNNMLDSKYLGLFSKRNAFIYPKQKIEQSLVNLYPRIAEVGIDTESFEILNIKIKERNADAIWCAAVLCYLVDENGYIFSEYNEPQQGKENDVVLNNLAKLYGGDQLVGPEPVGKSIFTPKLYSDIQNTVVELKKIGIRIDTVHMYSRDEIVFSVATGGKLIFSDRKDFTDSLEDLKSSLNSSVFVGTSSASKSQNSSSTSQSFYSSSSNSSQIVLPPNFEYIDVRFGNKVFYKINKAAEEKTRASSTVKN